MEKNATKRETRSRERTTEYSRERMQGPHGGTRRVVVVIAGELIIMRKKGETSF
jgi:hypothetical protein